MASLLAALLLWAPSGLQDQGDKEKSYEFLPPPALVAGDVYRVVADETDSLWATFYEGSDLVRGLKKGDRISLDATQEILEAERGRPLSARWTFAKALRAKNDNEKPLPFQGKSVQVSVKEGLMLFKYQPGTYLPLEDLKAIRQPMLGLEDPGPEESRNPVFEDVFSPGRTLKVGEPWDIPIRQAVRMVGGPGRLWAIDEKTSTAKASLASVEKRGQALYGRLKTECDFKVNALETLQLEKPIPIRVQIDYVGAIDGSRPDVQWGVKVEFKGVSPAKDPSGRRLRVEFDSTFERRVSRKYVTKE
jgi:hypothetical protein